jgi:hypothetical protein
MKKAGCGGIAVGLLFSLFWCGMTFFADGAIVYQMTRQLLTLGYASTPGTVTHSEVKVERGSKNTSYKPVVTYQYEVAGQRYENQRIRFDQTEPGEKSANTLVARYPLNQQVTVYYDPQAPQTAVLERDLSAGNFFAMVFLAPFNALAIGMIGGALLWWRGRVLGIPTLGASVREDGFHTTIYVYKMSPALAALAAWGGSGFALTFLVLLAQLAMPLDWAVAGAWVLLLIAPIVGWWLAKKWYFKIQKDLLKGTFEVRDFDGLLYQVAEQDLQPARWKMRRSHDKKGKEIERFPISVRFVEAGNQTRKIQMCEQTSEEEATRFVTWFNQRMLPQWTAGPVSE